LSENREAAAATLRKSKIRSDFTQPT